MAKGYCVHPRVPEMKGARPNEQARKILKPILILLTTQFHEWRIIALTFQSSSIRIPQFVCLQTLSVLHRSRIRAEALVVLSLASRQDLERLRVTLSYFVT